MIHWSDPTRAHVPNVAELRPNAIDIAQQNSEVTVSPPRRGGDCKGRKISKGGGGVAESNKHSRTISVLRFLTARLAHNLEADKTYAEMHGKHIKEDYTARCDKLSYNLCAAELFPQSQGLTLFGGS